VALKSFKDDEDPTMINYFGTIYIGGKKKSESQTFKILFDSGSTDIFVLGDSCDSSSCSKHAKYHKTANYKKIKDNSSIHYISGSINSEVGSDDTIIGNYLLEDMPIHVASNLAIPAFQDSEWDGLVGLGFTMQKDIEDYGMSIIDRFKDMQICKEKFFVYRIGEEGGIAEFCEFPEGVRS
jgi:hypothetical protein